MMVSLKEIISRSSYETHLIGYFKYYNVYFDDGLVCFYLNFNVSYVEEIKD